jgi:hypothetical protein
MEPLTLAISGVERALRPATPPGRPGQPSWVAIVCQQLPRVVEALGAERTEAGECSLTARAKCLAVERTRLLRRLNQVAPSLSGGSLSPGTDPEELRRSLLRLLHDVTHHHQRVNDLVYDAGWRDVGGSE